MKKHITNLFKILVVSIAFNWIGTLIGKFLIYHDQWTSSTPLMIVYNLIAFIFLALIIAVFLVALYIAMYLMFHLGSHVIEHKPFDTELIIYGWVFCLNVYVLIQTFTMQYSNINVHMKVAGTFANAVFGYVLIFYIICGLYKLYKFIRFAK